MTIKGAIYACCPPFLRPTLARIEASDIGYRLAKGTFWSMAGAAISRGLMLVASIVVARILGKTGFGELGMIQSTVGMFGVFAGFGLGMTATKYVAEFRKNDPERAGHIIALSELVSVGTGGLMALGLFIFAPWLAEHTINAPHLAGVLRIGAAILFISALNGAQTGALSGFEAFKTIAYVNLFVGLISFPILICGAYFAGLTGAVWALAINLGFNWLLNQLALRMEARRHLVPFNFGRCGRELSVLWRFSLPAVLAAALFGPVNWVCSALLVNGPDGYGEMGLYSAANQWYAMLLFLPGLLGGVVFPVLSERLGQKDTKQSQKTMILAMKVNALLVLPVVLVASIVSPLIMGLYGEGFGKGWPTLVVVLLTTGLAAVQAPVGHIMDADARLVEYFRWGHEADLLSLYTPQFLRTLNAEPAMTPMLDFLAPLPASVAPLERMLALEQRFFLADHNLMYTDKMSMAAGVEVRVPFLDLDLVDFAARIPVALKQHGRVGKWILKRAMEPYLPHDVIYRPKTGFGAPLRRWMRHDLRELLGDLLSAESLNRRGMFDPAAVQRLIAANDSGKVDASYTLLSLLCVEIWCGEFLGPNLQHAVV